MFTDKHLEEIAVNENQPMVARLLAELLLESRQKEPRPLVKVIPKR